MDSKTISILAPFIEGTGNTTSARRVASYLSDAGYRSVEFKTEQPVGSFIEHCDSEGVAAAIGFHGVHSGKHLANSAVPYAIIFCNTDLNVDLDVQVKRAVMTAAAERARFIGCYHPEFEVWLKELFPKCADRVVRLGKGVVTDPSAFDLRASLKLSASDRLVVLPTGLRAVKDPLFLAFALEEIGLVQDQRVHLAILGAARDESYAEWVFAEVERLNFVHALPQLPIADCHAAIAQADVVVNSSVFEGVPNSLLEAMDLKTPVVARKIPGNTAIVAHEETGLLFSTPDGGIEQVRRVLIDSALRERLVLKAHQFLREYYSVDKERLAYLRVVGDLLAGPAIS